jgi:hypothetical protein
MISMSQEGNVRRQRVMMVLVAALAGSGVRAAFQIPEAEQSFANLSGDRKSVV